MTVLQQYLWLIYASCLIGLLGVAAWQDIATRTIADGISIALVALGLVVRLSMGLGAFAGSLLVAVTLFLVLLPFCSRGVLGGADLKLMTAIAVGLPPATSLYLLLVVTVIGGVLAALYLAAGSALRRFGSMSVPMSKAAPRLRRVATVEFWRMRRRASLPYGLAIAAGATFVILQQGV